MRLAFSSQFLNADPLGSLNTSWERLRRAGELLYMNLAIELSEDQQRRLTEIAERLGVPISSLAEAAVRELIARPEADFEQISERILEKNRDLYERLG